ncbi:D-fructose 1,6-bisphosphatase [Arboricoccus pini]|uniref:Fructose-1,6-bisphosphatase class 1 n=1 Tax=Arboricoccus pini TaxID=1963835 RepID=A0A212Q330_9PROT|nr:class 1 fructose-bisphosphatase [Arboricoccus pini]SNB53664.1 D-fructose 1,6-bisphosphatase [Arboricoccus pini]
MTLLLDDRLKEWAGANDLRRAVAATISSLARASSDLAGLIAKAPLLGDLAVIVGGNAGGDAQKELDVRADALFRAALRDAPVAELVSEEADDIVHLNASAPLSVAIDPLDGSSNIETNVAIGTIFGIWPKAGRLQPGDAQLASGFVVYGPQTMLVLTLRDGVEIYVLDPDARHFVRIREKVAVRPERAEYAINASNYRHWDRWLQRYVDDCQAGIEGALQTDYNTRWIASLVAEAFRILARGGIFLYPGDARQGYAQGRLRLLYEAAPLALIFEEAGGAATDGDRRILEKEPDSPHQRTPLIIGSRDHVDRLGDYRRAANHGRPSPLFAQRGLYHR